MPEIKNTYNFIEVARAFDTHNLKMTAAEIRAVFSSKAIKNESCWRHTKNA